MSHDLIPLAAPYLMLLDQFEHELRCDCADLLMLFEAEHLKDAHPAAADEAFCFIVVLCQVGG
jgi:hypothetical protein